MKKLKHLEVIESELIHSPFYPEEIRVNDGLKAKVLIKDTWRDYRVWAYSPFGIEILVPKSDEFVDDDIVTIELSLLEDEIRFESIKVSSVKTESYGTIVGFRTFRKDSQAKVSEDRRKTTRWSCPQDMLPTGTTPNPLKYNDYIIFRVEDISCGGLRLITSMRNRLVYIGQHFEANISLPLIGNVSAVLKVVHVDTIKRDSKEYLSLGTTFVKPNKILLACLSEYLLHFGKDVSTSTLKRDGFPISGYLKSFDFSYVKNTWEYEQVLNLRKKAYIAANKISDETSPKDMADEYDSRARVLIVKKDNDIIGSVRVMFHDSFEESELRKDGVTEIDGLNLDRAAEASRLCTHPNYRGIDIAYQLLSHFSLTAIKSDKRYIYGGATGAMIDFYQKAGWTVLDKTYTCSSLKNIPHKVVYVDLHQVVLGRNISRDTWLRIYKDMFYYLYEREIIHPNKLDLLRIKFFTLFN